MFYRIELSHYRSTPECGKISPLSSDLLCIFNCTVHTISEVFERDLLPYETFNKFEQETDSQALVQKNSYEPREGFTI